MAGIFIRLEKDYIGVKSGMKLIRPGEYEATQLPGGLAQYLVLTEQALQIEGLTPPPVRPSMVVVTSGPEVIPADTSQSFESWTNVEIEGFAQNNEIELGGATKKADMIAVIAEWVELNSDDGVG